MPKNNIIVFRIFFVFCIFFTRINYCQAIEYYWSAYSSTTKNSEFVSQAVPAAMYAGHTYPITVVMKNTGTETWTAAANYRLGSQNHQDNSTWGFGRVDLAAGDAIANGQSKTFTFNVTAPAAAGTYNFQWQMVQDGVAWFGDKTVNVAVNVTVPVLVPVSGKVTKTDNSPLANVKVVLCGNNGDATTDSAGAWSKSVIDGSSYCARVDSGLPSGWTTVKGSGNNSCHTDAATYESQVAGRNSFTGCTGTGAESWDLDHDNNLNFVASCIPSTCASLGFNCGTPSDGCGGTLSSCGTCAAGQECVANKCAVCTPNAVSGCKVCNAAGTAWVDDNSKCDAAKTCQYGQCITPCPSWSYLANIGGIVKYSSSVMAANDKLIITGVGSDNGIWANEFNPANNQNGWYSLGGDGTLSTGTSMELDQNNKVVVMANGTDNLAWKRIYQSSGNWSNWENIGSKNLVLGPYVATVGSTIYKLVRKQDGSTEIGKCGTACYPDAVLGCKVCKSDGSAWVDTDSKCTGGNVCLAGVCVDSVSISSITVSNGGDAGYIDGGDKIKITFNRAIKPESINDDLDEGDSVEDIAYSEVGGVSVSSAGVVTIKGIASFDAGTIENAGNFTVDLDLDSTGKILTVVLASGDDIEIIEENFGNAVQIEGVVEDNNGNEMKRNSDIGKPAGSFGAASTAGDPYIVSIAVSSGGDEEDSIDVGDIIKITFSEAINPATISSSLTKGGYLSGVTYSDVSGVKIVSSGLLTIKGIATFNVGTVEESENYTVKLALNSTGRILTITLTQGDAVEIENEDFSAAAQIGGTIEDSEGNEMESDSSINDPTGSFGAASGSMVISMPEIKEVYSGAKTSFSPSVTNAGNGSLVYSWSCTGGSLSSETVLNPIFTAPTVVRETNYTCTLSVTNRDDDSVSKSIKVVVRVKGVGQEMTKEEIRAAIKSILEMIANLKQQLAALGVKVPGNYSCSKITKVLRYQTNGDDEVKCLQEFLAAQGYNVAVTGNYDRNTRSAVMQFQKKYASEILAPFGLRSGSGNVGTSTRNKINELMAAAMAQ